MVSQAHNHSENAETAQPVSIKGFFKDGAVSAEIPLQEVGSIISEGRVVILKEVFDPQMMLDFRHALSRWSRENPPFPHGQSPSSLPDVNYHRIDDGVYKSAIAHIFHQYGFKSLDRLSDDIREQSTMIGKALLDLQNNVAGTDFEFSLTGMMFKVLHYPSGAGFLDQHVHPLEPQRVGPILSLSRLGQDVRSGGTFFLSPFGRVDTSPEHDIGDVILFRYDLPHGITVIDEDQTLDWNSEAGKWSVVLELRETYSLSQRA